MRRDGQSPYGQDGYVIGLREGRIKKYSAGNRETVRGQTSREDIKVDRQA